MTLSTRIKNIAIGIVLIAVAAIILTLDEDVALNFIGLILVATLMILGIGRIIFYFRMSRHMVGGMRHLFNGIIYLDLGVFALSSAIASWVYIAVYLIGIHLYIGIIDIMRGIEAMKVGGALWKRKIINGAVNILQVILVAVSGVILRDMRMMILIYALGLVYNGLVRFDKAITKTAIVYIP